MKNSLSVLSPWEILFKKVDAFFGRDPQIRLTMEKESSGYVIVFTSRNSCKLDSIEKLMRKQFDYGNITVRFDYRVVNENATSINNAALVDAFSGNPIVRDVQQRPFAPGDVEHNWTLLEPEVVQFYADDISDYYGCLNMLPTELAKDIFEYQDGLHFSMALKDQKD